MKTEIEIQQWFTTAEREPFLNEKVVVELNDGEITIGQLDDNPQRKCWLLKGTEGMFWRSFVKHVVKWRWMTPDEMVEYYKTGQLKL